MGLAKHPFKKTKVTVIYPSWSDTPEEFMLIFYYVAPM